MKKCAPALLLITAFLISGCTAGPGENTSQPQKTGEIIVLENVEVVPSEVRPERSFVLSGFVTNKAETNIKDVMVMLSDYCSSVFDVSKASCGLEQSDKQDICVFKQLNRDASSKFQWNFKAPPAGRTAGRDFDCNIAVKVNYIYTAAGSVSVSLASDADITARETPAPPVVSDGPVKIYLSVETPQPVGANDAFDVKIILKNEGEGDVEHVIPKSAFKITVPPGLDGGCNTPDVIDISKSKRESDPIYCTFKTPGSLPPRITKTILSEAWYSYKFSRTIPVKLVAGEQR